MHKSIPNTIDYIEMPTTDIGATRRFFEEFFGWEFQEYGPDYIAFDDGRMTGGFYAGGKTSDIDSGSPLIVFYHGDLIATRDKVLGLGGKITRDIFDFPGGKRFHFRAPGAGEFAVWSEK